MASAPPSPSSTQLLVIAFKQSLHLYRDLLMWKLGSTNRLDYRHYVTSQVINRGDEAIAIASRMMFQKKWKYPIFLNCNWGEHSTFAKNMGDPQLIAICGGGYLFFGKDGTLAPRVKMDLLAMNESKAPVILFGVGLNMLLDGGIDSSLKISDHDEITLRALCERVSLISVRDRRTQNLLANYTTKNVYLVGDPALVMGDYGRLPGLTNGKAVLEVMRIGINLPFHGMDANARIRRDLPKYIDQRDSLAKRT